MNENAIDISPVVHRAIHEALANPAGGEVIVRAGGHVGRVYLHREAIAWVTCDTVRTRLQDVLEADAGLDRDTLQAVIEECKHTRSNFGDTLLAWSLLSAETLRECLLKHNASHFLGILGLGVNVESMFVPRARLYSGALLFSYDEILERCAALRGVHSSILPPMSEANERLTQAYMQIPECRVLMVVDAEKRAPLAVWPPARLSLDEERSLAEMGLYLSARQRTPFDPTSRKREVIAVSGHDLFVICHNGDKRMVVALCEEFRNFGLSLSMARKALHEVCTCNYPQ